MVWEWQRDILQYEAHKSAGFSALIQLSCSKGLSGGIHSWDHRYFGIDGHHKHQIGHQRRQKEPGAGGRWRDVKSEVERNTHTVKRMKLELVVALDRGRTLMQALPQHGVHAVTGNAQVCRSAVYAPIVALVLNTPHWLVAIFLLLTAICAQELQGDSLPHGNRAVGCSTMPQSLHKPAKRLRCRTQRV